jgi:hypothetical protein
MPAEHGKTGFVEGVMPDQFIPRMIDLYSTLPKKNNHSASCERVAGRPTAAILDAPGDGAFAGGLVPGKAGKL